MRLFTFISDIPKEYPSEMAAIGLNSIKLTAGAALKLQEIIIKKENITKRSIKTCLMKHIT